MQDLFSDFRKYTVRRNIVILSLSVLSALSINVVLFGTDMGASLRTSVNDIATSAPARLPYDVSLQSGGSGSDLLLLRTSTAMTNVRQIRATLLVNPDAISIDEPFSDKKSVHIIRNANIPGVVQFIIELSEDTTFHAGDTLLYINYTKKSSEVSRVNLSDTEFTSRAGTYLLTNTSFEM